MTVKESSITVPDLEHEGQSFDWSDIQLFMLVAKSGSLRSASRKANRSVNSLRRRLQNLEHNLNRRLLVRAASGTHLTEHGQRLLAASEDMFKASRGVAEEFATAERGLSQTVSVDVEESLASFWLIPFATEYQRFHPDCQIDIQCLAGGPESIGSQCDISVRTAPPDQNSLMIRRLGYFHTQPFASRQFIDRHGEPGNVADLENFPLVECGSAKGDHVSWSDVISAELGGHVAVKTNAVGVQIAAVCQSAGIGLLPTFLVETDPRLVPLLDDLHFRGDVYLTYRRDAAEHRQVRSVIDWLNRIFDAGRSSWFSEHYISPSRSLSVGKNN